MADQSLKVKVLIVEDEIILASDIAHRLEESNYEVVGIASTADDALKLMKENSSPDIILIDIILKGSLDGIELARIVNEQFNIPFIFLTAHADSYFVERAKSVRPYAYMLKPFNDRQISVAIELALTNFSNKTPARDLLKKAPFPSHENQVLHIKDCLFLKKGHHFQRVPLEEIRFLEADGNYTTIHTKSSRFIYTMLLKRIEDILPPEQFMRVHRGYVVNIELVSGFEGNMLFMGDDRIPVSKIRRQQVFKFFRTI